jgi:acyl carrier protein
MYKTGDEARYLSGGELECLGRIDSQVKVRGFRIELGEIEAVLQKHPGIREAVVLAKDGGSQGNNTYLIAYVTLAVTDENEPASDPDADSHQELKAQLQHFLGEHLPAYMIPAVFVVLPDLPLTPNGKIDRKALRNTETPLAHQREHVAPRTPVEMQLVEIWSEIMDVEQISVHGDFFELGGHSLMAVQVVARIRDAFGIGMTVIDLFQMHTVAELAEYIEKCLSVANRIDAPRIPASEDEMEFRI